MEDEEILRILSCFNARELRFDRTRTVRDFGGEKPCRAVVLEGGLLLRLDDSRGNRAILGDYGPGDFLDSALLEPRAGTHPFSLEVRAGTALLLLDNRAASAPCERCCRAHLLYLRNAAEMQSQKEKHLLYKFEYLSRRSTREKIISYLAVQTALQGKRKVHVPYSRQEMADLLAVERSSMCAELSRMQSEGLLRFERKRFELLREIPGGGIPHGAHPLGSTVPGSD